MRAIPPIAGVPEQARLGATSGQGRRQRRAEGPQRLRRAQISRPANQRRVAGGPGRWRPTLITRLHGSRWRVRRSCERRARASSALLRTPASQCPRPLPPSRSQQPQRRPRRTARRHRPLGVAARDTQPIARRGREPRAKARCAADLSAAILAEAGVPCAR